MTYSLARRNGMLEVFKYSIRTLSLRYNVLEKQSYTRGV